MTDKNARHYHHNNNNNNNMNSQEWPVKVFRHSLASGWQALKASSFSKTTANAVRTTTVVRANPQAGAIVIRRLRLRVLLQDDTVVTRRHCSLRIQSTTGVRILVLRFGSPAACQGFGDLLLQYNPVMNMTTKTNDGSTSRELADYLNTTPLSSSLSCTTTTTTTTPQQQQDERTSVLYYVARLLCDAEFLRMMRSLEHSLLSCEDGRQLLEDNLTPPEQTAAVVNTVSPAGAST